MRTHWFTTLLLATANLLTVQSLAFSDEQVNTAAFVVEGRLFRGEEKQPYMTTRTVFHGNRAYDQLPGTTRTTVFDFEKRLAYLTDTKRSVRSDITFTKVLEQVAQLNKYAEEGGGFIAFLAKPTFVHEFHPFASTVTLSSPWITYTAEGHQSSSDITERFLEFADWSARLANVVHQSPYPAQARLELNEALRKQNWRVTQVTRTGGPRSPKLATVKCQRSYRTELKEQEVDFIRATEKQLKDFKRVAFSDYFSVEVSRSLAAKK